jgi:hypothetical protein
VARRRGSPRARVDLTRTERTSEEDAGRRRRGVVAGGGEVRARAGRRSREASGGEGRGLRVQVKGCGGGGRLYFNWAVASERLR